MGKSGERLKKICSVDLWPLHTHVHMHLHAHTKIHTHTHTQGWLSFNNETHFWEKGRVARKPLKVRKGKNLTNSLMLEKF